MSQFANEATGSASVVNPVQNRRATVRYHCAPATPGRVYAAEDVEFQLAWIMNLSKTGAGLWINKSLPVGLRIFLSIRATDGSRSFDMCAEVVRSFRKVTGDYFVGCKLMNPLTDDDLESLL